MASAFWSQEDDVISGCGLLRDVLHSVLFTVMSLKFRSSPSHLASRSGSRRSIDCRGPKLLLKKKRLEQAQLSFESHLRDVLLLLEY